MTGLLGGGHAIYWDAATGRARLLDCFCAVPSRHGGELLELQVPFGEELVHYAVGAASCAVPGVPAGLDALWRDARPASLGRPLRPGAPACPRRRGDAACARRLPRDARAGDDDARGRADLRARRTAPAARRAARPAGPRPPRSRPSPTKAQRASTSGSIAESLLALIDERDGVVTRADLAAYEAVLVRAGRGRLRRHALPHARRPGRHRRRRSRRLPPLGAEPQRTLQLLDALDAERGPETHTTNLVTVDADGQRVRPDDEPRPRLRRLATGARSASEQHARRGRPARRRASSRASGCRA